MLLLVIMRLRSSWWWSYQISCCCCSVKLCPTLQFHGLQHAMPSCPSPSPGVCPSSCPLDWWCHPTISSSVTLFSFCLQSFPASGSSPMSQLLASGGQSIGALTSVFPMNIQGWFPLRLTGLTRKRKMTKSLETLISGEGNDLSLYDNHTLVYCTFLDKLP